MAARMSYPGRGPQRRPLQGPGGSGAGMQASATGAGVEAGAPQMTVPQVGRTPARPPLPMGGQNSPQMGADITAAMQQPQAPPAQPMAGGPTSPMNIASMLQPNQQPPGAAPPTPSPLMPWGAQQQPGPGAYAGTQGNDLGPDSQPGGAGVMGGPTDQQQQPFDLQAGAMPMIMVQLLKRLHQT